MIPKIIHYCWFGRGKMTPLMEKCIHSWKKYCPDYQIVEWNEDNFDVNSVVWTQQAYEAKKYAFVADYVRLYALKQMGGIYMDTDQELLKSLDPFLKHELFMGFMDEQLSMGVIGARSDSKLLSEMFSYYKDRKFIVDDKFDQTPNTKWVTELMVTKGLKIDNKHQIIENATIYPKTYFCPTSCVSIYKDFTPETVAVHHWAMTWRSEKAKKSFARARRHEIWWYKAYIRLRYMPNRIVRSVFGNKTIDKLKSNLKK